MKTNKLNTLWIMLMSIFYTARTCGTASLKHLFGTVTRSWCDEELQRWVQHMVRILGIKCKIFNPHHTQPRAGHATIIMCNHSSLFDIPLSFMAFPHCSVRMLAKKELSHIPIFGAGMRAAEFPVIHRKDRRQAIRDLAKLEDLMKSGIVMWIAPEGTRSRTGTLQTFKKGAFITAIQTHATIIPIGIRGASSILPAHTFQLNLHQHAEVHIGEAISATDFTLENKEELIDKVHQSIKALMGE